MTGSDAGGHDLDMRWQSLPRPPGEQLGAERVRNWAGGQVLAAVDAMGRRHLLVRIADGSRVKLPRPLSGLGLEVRKMRPSGQPDATWIVLSPTDPAGERPFTGLATDVVNELPLDGPADTAALFGVIERWRRFFGRSRDGLSHEDQLGLIGELWLLLEWLPAVTIAAVHAWKGPLRGRHDWVSDQLSVEVKTTGAATGPVVHRVNRLDQLDEPTGSTLYLLSVRAVSDASGVDSLDALLERARAAATAAGTTCAALLDDRLRALDVTQADIGRYNDPVRVDQADLYEVTDGFPRLIPASFPGGLPAGISDVGYNLDTSACGNWLVARRPEETQMLVALT